MHPAFNRPAAVADARFYRGESIVIVLEAVGATPTDLAAVASVDAVLKTAIRGAAPNAAARVAATFAVEPFVAAGELGPGWTLRLSAAQSAALAPGVYVTNAAVTYEGGEVEKTDALLLQIDQATT